MKKYLVLSGGGCRGFAHIGVVKALQEANVELGGISATSAGAIAGAFLANGYEPEEIREIFSGTKLNLFAWNGFKPGLISAKNIRELLHRELRFQDFEELTIPLYITATNFMDGSQKIFSSGDIADAVIAACSIPIIFPPVMIDNIPYVDGGLSNNLPTEPFTNSKKDIICVYVNPIRPFNPKEGVMEIMDRSIHLSFRGMVSRSASGCGVYIEPPLLSNYGMFDIHKMDEIIGVGYAYAKDYIKTVNME